jgi:hypothetical protein
MGERKFKSSKDLAGGNLRFIKPKELADSGTTGPILEGTYMGTVLNDLTEKNDFKFLTEDDSTVIINNTGHLQYLISAMQVKEGDYCRVSYNGKKPYKGKESHEFELEVAE